MPPKKNGSGPLEGYVEVHERIEAFYEKYPNGCLQGDYTVEEIAGETLIVYKARAYRDEADRKPAIGYASEPYPGKTSFTRGSEIMNAETSAWGRAIAALGFEVKRGIASGSEVRNRQSEDGSLATANQKRAITTTLNKGGLSREFQAAVVHAIAGDPPTKRGASRILDVLNTEGRSLEENCDTLVDLADVTPPSADPAPDMRDLAVDELLNPEDEPETLIS